MSRATRAFLAAIVGNAFQFYDFFLYATASALVFDHLFFPNATPAMAMMASFASYAVGFVSRPLGALVFGTLGDRFGRKVSMTWTLLLMGVATMSIGLLPSYDDAGMLAPLGLIGLRLLQGFATGGEWGGGMLMATENAPAGRRGYFGAWSQAGVGVGFILATGVFHLARRISGEEFLSWGWRIPFLASLLVVAVGLLIRRRAPESLEFEKAAHEGHPLRQALRDHWRSLLTAGGLLIAEMSGPMLSTSFAMSYGRSVGVDGDVLLQGVMLSMVADTAVMLAFGHLSDKIGRTKVYLFGILSFAAFIYPFFLMIASGSTAMVLAAFILINGICHAAMIGAQPALLTELFPVSVRLSGLALAQSMAVLLVGFVPLAAQALYSFADIRFVVLFDVLLSAISVIALASAGQVRHNSTSD